METRIRRGCENAGLYYKTGPCSGQWIADIVLVAGWNEGESRADATYAGEDKTALKRSSEIPAGGAAEKTLKRIIISRGWALQESTGFHGIFLFLNEGMQNRY